MNHTSGLKLELHSPLTNSSGSSTRAGEPSSSYMYVFVVTQTREPSTHICVQDN